MTTPVYNSRVITLQLHHGCSFASFSVWVSFQGSVLRPQKKCIVSEFERFERLCQRQVVKPRELVWQTYLSLVQVCVLRSVFLPSLCGHITSNPHILCVCCHATSGGCHHDALDGSAFYMAVPPNTLAVCADCGIHFVAKCNEQLTFWPDGIPLRLFLCVFLHPCNPNVCPSKTKAKK